MPKFLENKLRAEYGNNPHAIYGTMNKLGAMHGNKETAKGREMEKKHMHDFSHTTITHHSDGSHTIQHHGNAKRGKSGAFSERSGMKYSAGSGAEMVAKLKQNLGLESPEHEAEEGADLGVPGSPDNASLD